METPAPIDLNKLKTILGNAKKVMAKVEERHPTAKAPKTVSESFPSHSTPMYDERDEREPVYKTPNMSEYESQISVRDYTKEDILNSKLPQAIKEAMLKNPIPKASMSFSKFNLEDVEDLIEKPKNKPQRQPITEQVRGSETISISKEELNEMIDRRISEVLANMFAKTITEQTVKKTISLIQEGKLTVKKK